MTETVDPDFSKDLLRGADAIAAFLFGDEKQRRKIYHLAATSNMPVFKLGSLLCGRRSILLTWVKEQEQRHAETGRKQV
jgi:hypothetical protein